MISYVINWIRSLFVSPTPNPPPSREDEAQVLLTLHNQQRTNPLAIDPFLEQYARAWATRMAAMNVLRHSNGPYAENIAWFSDGGDPAQCMALWLSDRGHRQNALNPYFRRAGFARSGNYWCGVYA